MTALLRANTFHEMFFSLPFWVVLRSPLGFFKFSLEILIQRSWKSPIQSQNTTLFHLMRTKLM